MPQIDQKYFGESILYTFLLHHVINYDKLQEFRGSYLQGLENNDIMQSTESIEAFKNNLESFLMPEFQYIDTAPFIHILEQLESYYRTILPDEFHSFRRYQYSTLFFSYVFFVLHKDDFFREQYLQYIDQEILIQQGALDIAKLVNFSFNRLGYRMATGCGKTLLMYAVVYMYCKLFSPDTKTLYIIVPSDELRKQHKEFIKQFAQAGLSPIKDGVIVEFSNIPLFGDHEINGKLTTISGISNAQLSPNSIVLMDEAHKGASSEAGAIETLKNNYIDQENTFLFEFSATFQEAFKSEAQINATENLFDYYHFSSVYKYNLFDFNADGFGKDYRVQAVKKTSEDEVTDKRILVCRALINFALQLRGYANLEKFTQSGNDRTQYTKHTTYLERNHDGLRVYKPLFLGLSWKLDSEPTTQDGAQSETTLTAILRNIAYIFTHLDEFKEEMLAQRMELQEFYSLLTGNAYEGHGIGLQIRYDKQSDEIKLWLGKSLMLINTGQNAKIAEKLKNDPELATAFAYQDLLQSKRLFNDVDTNEDILFLFGSKKFIEGWDSKRPSTILLFKMGGSSTVIATQILGRGLRLYGIRGDGYRHLNYSTKSLKNPTLKYLEQICLFGYDIDEFEKFIEALAGEQYKVAVIKKREYATSFRTYLDALHIDYTDDEQVNGLFADRFPLLEETLDEGEESELIAETLTIKKIGGKLHFVYSNNGAEKTMGTIKGLYSFLSEVRTRELEGGQIHEALIQARDPYSKTYNEILGEHNVHSLTKSKLQSIRTFTLSDEDIALLADHIGACELITDKFSPTIDQSDHCFDLSIQHKIIDYYVEHIENMLNAVSNRFKNYQFKSIDTRISHLKTTHLIDDLRLEFTLHKKDDKDLAKLFFGDSPKLNLEKNYEELSFDQQSVIANLFVQNKKDFHIYERLYYFPNKIDKSYLHDIDNSSINVRTSKFTPFELNVNKNEEQKIESILHRIENNPTIKNTYDIFYLRNLVGKKGVPLRYENIDGEYANFYPDFLVWFINKSNQTDITLVYLEPKGDGIDKNREKKQEKLEEITSSDVPQEVSNLFGIKVPGNKKYTGIKILGVMQMEF